MTPGDAQIHQIQNPCGVSSQGARAAVATQGDVTELNVTEECRLVREGPKVVYIGTKSEQSVQCEALKAVNKTSGGARIREEEGSGYEWPFW